MECPNTSKHSNQKSEDLERTKGSREEDCKKLWEATLAIHKSGGLVQAGEPSQGHSKDQWLLGLRRPPVLVEKRAMLSYQCISIKARFLYDIDA